ncbi:MAG: hypothetical protein AAB968_03320, partial [Patescibacteria group bacterium]
AINSDAAGYTAMRNFLIAPPNGATRLRIIIDPNNAQVEVDEGNNSFTLSYTPAAQAQVSTPNLVIENPSLSSTHRLTYTLANRGAATSTQFAAVYYEWLKSDNSPVADAGYGVSINMSHYLETGSPGSVMNFDSQALRSTNTNDVALSEFLSRPPQGAMKLRLTADSNRENQESDEGDNIIIVERSRPAEPEGERALPNFVVEGASLAYTSSVRGQGHLAYTIRNIGPGATPHQELWVLHQWVNGSGVRVGPVIPVRIDQAFAVGSSFVFDSDTGLASQVATVDYMLERPLAGAVKLRIIVDPWEYYQEGSAGETNNIADIDRPVPDYLIDSVEFNGAVLKFAIHNQGQGVPAYRRVSNVFYTDVVLRLQWLGSGSENLLSKYSSPGDYGNVAIGTSLTINSDAAGYTAMRNFLIA